MPDSGSVRGRGATTNPPNRFDRLAVEPDPTDEPRDAPIRTEYYRDSTRTIIASNDSPDIPYERSVNPYRGCDHGCIYCYARPYHEYLGLSAGLDFETRIFVKDRAPELLRAELTDRSWHPQVLALSGVTDAYQPIERTLELTRRCLQVLAEFRNPVAITTKNALVVRDIDVLEELARHKAVSVAVSVTTLDESLRRAMEPRTATADHRFETVARLNDRGIPAGVMVAPVIPGLTDHEVPRLLGRAAEAGARFAGYSVVRLPHGVATLFEEWLDRHYPLRKTKVLRRIRDVRGGSLNDSCYGSRMKGAGRFAELIEEVFCTARERAGIPSEGAPLSTAGFRRPSARGSLLDLLDPPDEGR